MLSPSRTVLKATMRGRSKTIRATISGDVLNCELRMRFRTSSLTEAS